jgi:PAS domain S-box-containing protein
LANSKPKKAGRFPKPRQNRAKPTIKSKDKRKNMGLLSEVVQSIRDYGIFMLDPSGTILTWNDGAKHIKGYSEEEIVGQNFRIFYLPEDIARHHPDAELEHARKTGRYEEEGWRLRKDRTKFWASVVITRITNRRGRLVGFAKVTRDLTARKEMEERLRESEERFRLLVGSVKDYAIFMLDPNGFVMNWNEGAAQIKGYLSEEIVGKHFSQFYPPEEVAAGKCEFELEEATRVGRFEDEGWRVRKDGSLLWANVVITAVRDAKGRLIGFSKVTRDLSERKKAEDKLQKSYAGLERRVQERTRELSEANEELEQRERDLEEALKARDEFLSIASHELKTPMTSLKMQLQMLRQKTRPERNESPPPEKLTKGLETSLRQVDRLTKLVEDLLDVARASARKVSYRMESVDLGHLVRDVADRLKDQIEAAGCRVELDVEEARGQFDPFRLDQVLENLVMNATKYAAGSKITLMVRTSGQDADLVVKDEGRGIPPESLGRLFERFERGPNSQYVNGLGLGLYISRQIVEGHHGSIRADSEEGKGTTFTIHLPLRQPPLSHAQVAP